MKLSVYHAWYKLANSGENRMCDSGGWLCYRDLIFISTSLSCNQIYLSVLAESQDICSWWNFDISNFPFHSKLEENQVFFMFPVNALENNNSRLAHMTVPLIRRKDMFLVSSITVSLSPQKVTFRNISFSRAVSILHPHLTTIFWCKDIKNKIEKSTLHQSDMTPLWHINYSVTHIYKYIFNYAFYYQYKELLNMRLKTAFSLFFPKSDLFLLSWTQRE